MPAEWGKCTNSSLGFIPGKCFFKDLARFVELTIVSAQILLFNEQFDFMIALRASHHHREKAVLFCFAGTNKENFFRYTCGSERISFLKNFGSFPKDKQQLSKRLWAELD